MLTFQVRTDGFTVDTDREIETHDDGRPRDVSYRGRSYTLRRDLVAGALYIDLAERFVDVAGAIDLGEG